MSLDFLDDVLLLDLAFEKPQRAFQGFSILDVDFRQTRLICLYATSCPQDTNFLLSTR